MTRPILAGAAMAVLLLAMAGPLAATGDFDALDNLEASARDFAVGLASQRRGDWDGARQAYRAALAKDPTFVEAAVNLARVLVSAGELEAAQGQVEQATQARPDYPGLHGLRGLVALESGRLRLAANELALAERAKPDDLEVLTNLGAALLSQGRPESALRPLRRAIELVPDALGAVFNLALAADAAGRRSEALYYYRRYLTLAGTADPRRASAGRRARMLAASPPADVAPGAEFSAKAPFRAGR